MEVSPCKKRANQKGTGWLLCRRQVRYMAEQSRLGVFHRALLVTFPFLFFLFCFCLLCFWVLIFFNFFFFRKKKGGGKRNKTREKCQKTFSTISKNREPWFLSRQYEFWMDDFFQFSTPMKIFAKSTTSGRSSSGSENLLLLLSPSRVISHQRTKGRVLFLQTLSANTGELFWYLHGGEFSQTSKFEHS